MPRKKKTNTYQKPLIFVFVTILLIGGGWLLYNHYHKPKPASLTPAQSQSSEQPSQNTPSPAPSKPNPGGVVDKNGQTSGTLPPSSQWTTSSSGDITLQQPTAGSTVNSGDTLSGLASVSTVQFILTDSSVGLIDQGSLNVVDGKFAGTLAFTAHSSSGKLEVYSPNPTTGAEENLININVNLGN